MKARTKDFSLAGYIYIYIYATIQFYYQAKNKSGMFISLKILDELKHNWMQNTY